jgi:hypothetical protein
VIIPHCVAMRGKPGNISASRWLIRREQDRAARIRLSGVPQGNVGVFTAPSQVTVRGNRRVSWAFLGLPGVLDFPRDPAEVRHVDDLADIYAVGPPARAGNHPWFHQLHAVEELQELLAGA